MKLFLSKSKKVGKWALKKTFFRKAIYKFSIRDKPFLIRLDVNNTCNQLCKKCFYPDYLGYDIPPHYMSLEEFRLLASKLFDFAYYLQLPFGFEPLMHPQFAQMVKIVDEYSIANVGLVTNGTMLSGEKAEAILDSRSITALAVSLDGINYRTYDYIRGKSHLHIVLSNIADFQKWKRITGKRFPQLIVNTVIMRSNLNELPLVMDWCVKNDVDEVQFFHVKPIDSNNDESMVSSPEAYNEIHDEIGAMAKNASICLFMPPPFLSEDFDPQSGRYLWRHCQEEKRSDYDTSCSNSFDPNASHPYPRDVFCICPWMTLVIDSWGNLYPCAHRTNVPFANILSQRLDEAVNSIKILKLRRAMLLGRHDKACPFCRAETPTSDPMRRKATRVLYSKEEMQDKTGVSSPLKENV